MYFVDRSIAIVKPSALFLQWLLALPGHDLDLTLEQIQADATVYMLPEAEEAEDAIGLLDDRFAAIFEMELASWTEDEQLWPQDRGLKAFWEWFDVQVHTSVIDTLEEDELDDDEQV
jgi:hypothetical protein